MTSTWDPAQYLRYSDERSRPFGELLSRVAADPALVVDLGCGPGHLVRLLLDRWPSCQVLGLDSSPEMLQQAQQAQRAQRDESDDRVRFELADLIDWAPNEPVDVVVSNATLQWVPGHLDLLPGLADRARQVFAFSVPGNHDAPSHALLRDVAARPEYAAATDGVARPSSHDPQVYLEALARPGWSVDAWETTYLHVLQGDDPVLEWIRGTSARPTLAALNATDPALREAFEAEYGASLREAYPTGPAGTVLPFRRIFCVATRT